MLSVAKLVGDSKRTQTWHKHKGVFVFNAGGLGQGSSGKNILIVFKKKSYTPSIWKYKMF
jgi:hypothetical protein